MSKPRSSTLPSDEATTRSDRRARVPHIYLALEGDRPLAGPSRHSLSGIDEIVIGRGDERSVERVVSEGSRQLVLRTPDARVSSTHVQIRRDNGFQLQDMGSTNGTFLNGAATKSAQLEDGDLVEVGRTFFLFREDAAPIPGCLDLDASAIAPPAVGLGTIVPDLAHALAPIVQLSHSKVPILVQAESGTGKELVARAVHTLSERKGDFVAVNCGAIPQQLVESELFGHRKGAFSGANEERLGLVRSADRGTLFLDEIGDLPASSQAALLRVLQEQEVTPVGAAKPIKVDVRFVAATHRDLGELVKKGAFRKDLLARISGFLLELPPLRERREDIGLLVATLLRRHLPTMAVHVSFTAKAARALFRHPWPLNVRELEKALEAAVVLAGGTAIDDVHLPAPVRSSASEDDDEDDVFDDGANAAEDVARKDELLALLRVHGGNVSAVARAMGKARMQIHRWMKRYGIEPKAATR